jgi:hypothetical protein
MRHDQPPARLLRAVRRPHRGKHLSQLEEHRLCDGYRELLREYRTMASNKIEPSARWRNLAAEALSYLGGDADRVGVSLRDYDHRRYGPFLGVSDDGGAALDVSRAARASPKAQALDDRASPLAVGVALDAERLGGVGEVPVGPDEFSDIWRACAGRTLMTTNVGSRANVRHYLPPPIVTIADGETGEALASVKAEIAAAFSPFLKTPDKKPRPLVVFVEFRLGSSRKRADRKAMLQKLVEYTKSSGIAAPKVHRLGLNVRIGWGPKGRDSVLEAIDLARGAGIRNVSVDGVVRKVADRAISHPGLTNYLAPGLVGEILQYAAKKGVRVRPLLQVDPDTVARSIWSALNTARAMGLHLGKYSLLPLTLDESERVVDQVQRWFSDWSAAPVFYVDQGIIDREGVYVERNRSKGVAVWLRAMAKHGVKVVLIDTADKSKGWKLLRSGDDPKGLLSSREVSRLAALGERLGIKVLWAGGITGPQAYELGKLGVFGIYVTTAAAMDVAVTGTYLTDPAMAKGKRPTFAGVLSVKTLLEAGYLSQRLKEWAALHGAHSLRAASGAPVEFDVVQLSKTLPTVWRQWWRGN